MKKRLLYGLVLAALGLNLLWGTQLYFSSAQAAEKNDVYGNLELFTTVLERIRQDYVDGKDLTYQDLIYAAIKGMVNTLDPHSEFLPPTQYKELINDTEGSFGGVGILIGVRNGFLTVVQPMEGTPAFKAGLLPGDRIIKVDGNSTENIKDAEDAVKWIRGRAGSTVTLTVSRPGVSHPMDFKLERAVIKVPKVKDINGQQKFPLSEGDIGYVRLLQFDEQTSDDLGAALEKLKGEGMKALILDLRDNPGGLLDQAVKVCSLFLPRGHLVVSTEGRMPSDNIEYRATGGAHYLKVPMVVLVNGGSASAAEIVSGCLQDLKRAILVGEKTFGKGSVQKILQLQNGAALKLTTAKYYTPSHRVIHEHGITPDIVVPMSQEVQLALYFRRTPGGLDNLDQMLQSMSPDKRHRLKQLVEKARDVQLDRAMDLLKGVLLYTQRTESSDRMAAR